MPAWGILVFWSGIEPMPPALEAQSPNYRTMREVPQYYWLYSPPHPWASEDSTNPDPFRLNPWMRNPWMWRADSTTPFYGRELNIMDLDIWKDPITSPLQPLRDDCILCAVHYSYVTYLPYNCKFLASGDWKVFILLSSLHIWITDINIISSRMILKFLLCLRNSKVIGCIANVQISLGMLWITKMAILHETKSLSDLLFHEDISFRTTNCT